MTETACTVACKCLYIAAFCKMKSEELLNVLFSAGFLL